MRTKALLLFVLILPCVTAAPPSLEFIGYASLGGERRFVISDPASKRTSEWLVEGQIFQGYTIVGFNSQDETLSLRNASGEIQLRLRSSRVTTGSPAPDPKNLTIGVTREGLLSLAGETVDLATLESRLRSIAATNPEIAVVMRLQRDFDFQKIKPAIEKIAPLLKQVGFKKFTVTHETERQASPTPRP